MIYGGPPIEVWIENSLKLKIGLREFMHYQYLPVMFPPEFNERYSSFKYPANLSSVGALFTAAYTDYLARHDGYCDRYVYVSAKKGVATALNPLNRPGWHTDGFGTDDENYIWYKGAPTRFAVQEFEDISTDHTISMHQFEEQIDQSKIVTYPDQTLYRLDPSIVHQTPEILVAQRRQFIKISFSRHQYNLEDNSHNYLFNYNWKMHPRDSVRNDPHKGQLDFVG